MAISPRSSIWGDPGEEPGTVAHRLHPGYGCSPDIATHCPRPAGEGAERRRRGRGGGAGRSVWVACRLKAGRDGAGKEQGVWSVRDRGGGTSSPSPSAPPPNAISPRSSARLPTGSTPGTAFHQVSRALPPPAGRGRGRSAEGAGGVEAAGRSVWVSPCEGAGGVGVPVECMVIPLDGNAGEEYGNGIPTVPALTGRLRARPDRSRMRARRRGTS